MEKEEIQCIIENIKISYAGIYKGVAHFVGPSIRVAILDDRIIFTRGLNVQKLFEELEAYIAC